MSQIDLSTHSAAIKKAFDDVRNGSGFEWLLLDYEGKSNTLTVSETGKGLEDLQEEFNDGKIQYAYCRVIDQNTQLPKYVFISWCGEGVPEMRKGMLQLHTSAVEKYFKGFHVHINARSEKDVDEATIMKKVRDSSGANYSFHKEQAKPAVADKPQSVGSNYEKPVIQGRAKTVDTSVFTKPPTDFLEEKRKIEEQRRKQEEEERGRVMMEQRKLQEEEQRAQAAQREQNARMEQQRKEEQDALRRQEEERSRRLQEDQRAQQREEEERRRVMQERQAREDEENRRRAEEEARSQAQAAAAAAAAAATSAPSTSEGAGMSATVIYDYDAADTNEISLRVGEVITQIEQIDEGWWQGRDPRGNFGMFPSTYVTPSEAEAPAAAPAAAAPAPEPVYEEPAAPAAQETHAPGTTALALYDYDATEEGELSFGANELITEISALDENWWQGKNPRGEYGMFPANYVQMQ